MFRRKAMKERQENREIVNQFGFHLSAEKAP